MVTPGKSSKITEGPDVIQETESTRTLKHFPPYGAMVGSSTGDTCPTCHGTGRIPRGQEDQLVAVIPCNDVRLKPRRTKLYMFVTMLACLLLCCVILFFLFPRSIALSPVSVQKVMVYYTRDTVDMQVTNVINITNENFVPVQIVTLNIQGLIFQAVVGDAKMTNMSGIQARSQKSYVTQINLSIQDEGINNYCKSSTGKIHTLYLALQMTMNISYLSHTEQLTLNTHEYIDCGNNSTIPHPMNRLY